MRGITGPPNVGMVAPTVERVLPTAPTDLRAEDLDGDGHDEVLLLMNEMIHVADVDTTTGAVTITGALVEATSFELLGHHQVLVRPPSGAGTEVATFSRTDAGWQVSLYAYTTDPGATLPIGDLDGDG